MINNRFLEDLRNRLPGFQVEAFSQRLQDESNKQLNHTNNNKNIENKTRHNNEQTSKNNNQKPSSQKYPHNKNRKKQLLSTFTQNDDNKNPYHNENNYKSNKIQYYKYCKQEQISYQNKQNAIFFNKRDGLPSIHSKDIIDYYYATKKQTIKNKNDTTATTTLQINNKSLLSTTVEYLNLKELNFYFCNIGSLRELGTGWKLKSLKIIKGNLVDLSGISGFSYLNSLMVSYNQIADLSDLTYNQTLTEIDLEGNNITDLNQMEYLETVTNLNYLNLDHNIVIHKYSDIIKDKFCGVLNLTSLYTSSSDNNILQQQQILFQHLNQYEGYEMVQLINQINENIYNKKMTKKIDENGRFCFDKKELLYGLEDIIGIEEEENFLQEFRKYVREKIQFKKNDNIMNEIVLKSRSNNRRCWLKERRDKSTLLFQENTQLMQNKENIELLEPRKKFILRKKLRKKTNDGYVPSDTLGRDIYFPETVAAIQKQPNNYQYSLISSNNQYE